MQMASSVHASATSIPNSFDRAVGIPFGMYGTTTNIESSGNSSIGKPATTLIRTSIKANAKRNTKTGSSTETRQKMNTNSITSTASKNPTNTNTNTTTTTTTTTMVCTRCFHELLFATPSIQTKLGMDLLTNTFHQSQ
eukprot:m.21630 g.21630  ORF g.21630 m.21630 type:complete len:138 (+) comp13485_c0_seq1:250-663(+)